MNQPGSHTHANDGPDDSTLHEGVPTTSNPARESTPFKPRSPVERLFSTYTHFRHPLLTSIGDDLIDSIVGPMPTQQFLDDFLPISCIPSYSRPWPFWKGCFQTTLDATDELKMYDPFVSECINCCAQYLSFLYKIESISPFAPQLHFVNSHSLGDKDNGYPFETKPDISVYHKSLGDKAPKNCESSLIDIHIKFKRYTWDDPFEIPTTTARRDSAFIAPTPNKTNTLGQIEAYATSQLASQFCTHCYSVYVNRDHTRIIRWERDGAIVTEPIFYNIDSALTRFFSRYVQAPHELCGIDTMVSPACDNKVAKLARSKLALPDETAMFETTVPRTADGLPFTVIFARPGVYSTTPFGRATRTCPAYDPKGKRLVFLKDSWRLDGDDIIPEGHFYAELAANHVPHIPQCLASGDMKCSPQQKTQMQKYSQCCWACQKGLAITPHIHYHLVLDLVGEALTTFASSKELVQVIHDALLGELYPSIWWYVI